jgi:hypothetical protein
MYETGELQQVLEQKGVPVRAWSWLLAFILTLAAAAEDQN